MHKPAPSSIDAYRLDPLLLGATSLHSLNVPFGEPQTGNPILAQQLLFNRPPQASGSKAIQVSALSAPGPNVACSVQGFAMLTAELFAAHIVMNSLTPFRAVPGNLGFALPKQRNPLLRRQDGRTARNLRHHHETRHHHPYRLPAADGLI